MGRQAPGVTISRPFHPLHTENVHYASMKSFKGGVPGVNPSPLLVMLAMASAIEAARGIATPTVPGRIPISDQRMEIARVSGQRCCNLEDRDYPHYQPPRDDWVIIKLCGLTRTLSAHVSYLSAVQRGCGHELIGLGGSKGTPRRLSGNELSARTNSVIAGMIGTVPAVVGSFSRAKRRMGGRE